MVHASHDPELATLRAQLHSKSVLIEALKAEVIRLRRWRFGASSEALDHRLAPELPLGMEATVAPHPLTPTIAPADRLPPRLLSVDTPRKPPARAPRTLPAELPRVIQIHAPARCQCPDCGAVLRRLGEDVAEQLDYVPGYFQVIRHVRPKLSCGHCAHIEQVAAPSRPIERGLPTAGLLAQVIGAKYADHCPLYRQEAIYQRAGLALPRTLLASWVAQGAALLDPLVRTLERYVLAGTKLHADDTPVPVLEPGRGKTRKARLWAYVRDDRPSASADPPAVVYRYAPDRRAIHPQAHLQHFNGTLQADGYAGFQALYSRAPDPLIEAACWAHARRKFHDVYVAERSEPALQIIRQIGLLYGIERQMRGQPPGVRRAQRQAQALPILSDLRQQLVTLHKTLSAKAPLTTAIQYTLTRWAALTAYAQNGQIEIDNNAAERAIRALVLGRRNYLFAGSDGGGETAANLYSLIGTCRLQGIDPYRYLTTVLACIAQHPINRIEELLPWHVAARWSAAQLQAA